MSFEVVAQFDTTDPNAAIEDMFAVYLADPNDPSTTLLDLGMLGTSLFLLAGETVEMREGLVTFNDPVVTIDVTELADEREGLLVFQLINSDTDSGTTIMIRNVQNVVDPDGEPLLFPPRPVDLEFSGDPVDLDMFTPSRRSMWP